MSRAIKLAEVLKKTRLAAVTLEIGGASGSYEDRPETKKMLDYAIRQSENFIRTNGPPDEIDGCIVPDYAWHEVYTDIYRSIDNMAKGVNPNDEEAVIGRIILGVRSFNVHKNYGESIGNNDWCSRKMYRMLSVNIKNYFENPTRGEYYYQNYSSRIKPKDDIKSFNQKCEGFQRQLSSISNRVSKFGIELTLEDFSSSDFNCDEGISEENKLKMYQKALSVVFNKINQDPAGYISGNEDFFQDIVENYSNFVKAGNYIVDHINIGAILTLLTVGGWIKVVYSIVTKNPAGILFGLAGVGLSTYSRQEISGFASCIVPKIKTLFQENLKLRRSLALLSAYVIIGKDIPEGKKIRVAGRLINPASESEFESERQKFSKIILQDILGDYSPYLSCYDEYPALSILAAKIMGFDVGLFETAPDLGL